MADRFDNGESNLARYATRFNAAEINSSFYRPHKSETYARWAASVPDGFRFAVKLPKAITHERRLVDCLEPVATFAAQTGELGNRRGPVLVQLPPTLVFDAQIAARFFDGLRHALGDAAIVCEPRHASWFAQDADQALIHHHIARVAADPAKVPEAANPGGWPSLRYTRLHGSPRIYYSSYDATTIARLADEAAASDVESWTIFDNTASGAAIENALAMIEA
ncbi:DUF72 domain-containing protein [Sphingomonas bacterium]|uniref:DUF72 domain-containing protein n=1 Tax=Sphingomonas bacterium TaxID=1895847 RepID=UPI00260BAF69|nr:DUF72 domain-containing protein [Sphingomonas bacterium]MDB5679300.1 hypothetical protein [Sphingomonas bacterium]